MRFITVMEAGQPFAEALRLRLGYIYLKLNEKEKAISCYQYCVDNGGETYIPQYARDKLSVLNGENVE